MWKSIPNVQAKIVQAALDRYSQLSKQGKPILHEKKAEWTVLASIVMIHCSTCLQFLHVGSCFWRNGWIASRDDYSIKVISLGYWKGVQRGEMSLFWFFNICRTGLKCLPFSKLCKTGDVLNDGHAEIIARRGFVKYVYIKFRSLNILMYTVHRYLLEMYTKQQDSSPFTKQDGGHQLELRPEYSLHMYVSQSPCKCVSMYLSI